MATTQSASDSCRIPSVDVVTTAIGGRDLAAAVASTDALLGFETGRTRPPERFEIDFCDYPFSREASFEEHLEVVKREHPTIAVAPDIEDGRSPSEVISQADTLAKHAETVVVVPKSEALHPREIPERFRVGVPLANFGSDGAWTWQAFVDVDELHLLGGSPTTQLEFGRYVDGVASVDGASVLLGAQKGTVWGPGRDRHWHPTGPEQMDYYERVACSIRNVIEAWRVQRGRRAGLSPMADYDLPDDPAEYAARQEAIEQATSEVETRRRYRRHGTRGARPAISPDERDLWAPSERDRFDVIDWEQEHEMARKRAIREVGGQTRQKPLSEFMNASQS